MHTHVYSYILKQAITPPTPPRPSFSLKRDTLEPLYFLQILLCNPEITRNSNIND